MTVKKGDIVFVVQGHTSQEVAAVVMKTVSDLDNVSVHILSSSDTYSLNQVKHRKYVDDIGYREISEGDPTESRPVETPAEDSGEDMPVVTVQADADTVSDSDTSDSVGDEAPDESESEEESDESEESEGSEEVSEDESDGQSISTPRRKRRKGRKG